MSSLPSIVIPSYNGLHRLKISLPSLLRQSLSPLEYILVIDGSDDGSIEWIRGQGLPCNFNIAATSNCGRSAARNLGASLARSDLLIFVDDDICVPFHFVERHCELQSLYPNSLISGDVQQDLNTDLNFDICAFRRSCEQRWSSSMPRHEVFCGFHFTTQNLSINQAVFALLGGFDQRLTDSEDFLLGVYAAKNSIPIYFDPSLVSYHCDYGDLEYLIRRNAEYISSKHRLAELCPDVKDNYSYVLSVPSCRGLFKNLVRRFFVYNYLWRKIIHSRVFYFLPKSLRFKVYDYILSSSVGRRLQLI